MYVELSSIREPGESRNANLEQVVDAAKRLFHPDQYVAQVLLLDAYDELARFFAGILLEGG